MSKHSIIIIKNNNKYLQYYDNDWKSYLFPNCKIKDSSDLISIKNYLKDYLEINNENIIYIGMRNHNKFSERHQKFKDYEHYFYLIEIKDYPEYMKQNNFEFNSNTFKWFSYDELLMDKRIQEVNSDIVEYIKEFEC